MRQRATPEQIAVAVVTAVRTAETDSDRQLASDLIDKHIEAFPRGERQQAAIDVCAALIAHLVIVLQHSDDAAREYAALILRIAADGR
jgi:hypothetical protein